MICIWQLDIVGPFGTDRVRFFSQGWCDRDVAPRVPSAIVAPSKPGKHMQLNQPETVDVRHSPEFSRSGDTDIVSDPAARSTVAAHGVLDMSKTPRVEKVLTCQCHDSSHAVGIFWTCPSKGRMTPHHVTTLPVADDPQPFSCLRSNPQNVTAVEVLARNAVVCFSRIYSVYIYIYIMMLGRKI